MPTKLPRRSGRNVPLPPRRRCSRLQAVLNSAEPPKPGEMEEALNADLNEFDSRMIEMAREAGDTKMEEALRKMMAKRNAR